MDAIVQFGPNKPTVPTALASPTTNPSRPLRRHIGQSLGRPDGPRFSSVMAKEALRWVSV